MKTLLGYPVRRVIFPALFICLVILALPSCVWAGGSDGALKPRSIAVLPWKVNSTENLGFISDAMVEMLSSRIGSAEGLRVVRPDVVKGALKAGVDASGGGGGVIEGIAARVGRRLKLDYVLYGSLTVLGDSVSMDSKLLDVKKGMVWTFYARGKGLDAVIPMADTLSGDVVTKLAPGARVAPVARVAPGAEKKGAPLPGTVVIRGVTGGVTTGVTGPKLAPVGAGGKTLGDGFIIKGGDTKPGFWKSAKLDGLFISFVSADLDHDGEKELFLVGRTRITVAAIRGGRLKVLKVLKAPPGVQYIGVYAMDSDLDEAVEVYVSGVRGNRAYSSMVELGDNGYETTLIGIRWLLRVIEFRGETMLVGQGFRESDGFYGALRVLKKDGLEIKDIGPFEITLPMGVDLYRFAAFEFNASRSGALDLLVIDRKGRLKVYNKGAGSAWTQYWKSPDYYGGTLNLIEPDDETGSAGARPVSIAGGFFPVDLDADGRAELIIKRNIPGGLGRYADTPRSFTKSSVRSVEWDGEFISENWRTREVTGYIADFFIDDLDSDGAPEVVMLVAEGSGAFFGGVKSYILSYRLSL